MTKGRKGSKREEGFTLTELMVSVVLSLLFTMGFFMAFYGTHTQLVRGNLYNDVNRGIRYGMDRLALDIKEAARIVTSWGGNTTGNNVLVLRLPSIDSNGVPTNIATQFDYVTYRLSSANSTWLVRSLDVLNGTSAREGGADKTNVLVAKNIQSVLFSNNGTGLSSISAANLTGLKFVNVQIRTQGQTLGISQTSEADADLMLRNNIP